MMIVAFPPGFRMRSSSLKNSTRSHLSLRFVRCSRKCEQCTSSTVLSCHGHGPNRRSVTTSTLPSNDSASTPVKPAFLLGPQPRSSRTSAGASSTASTIQCLLSCRSVQPSRYSPQRICSLVSAPPQPSRDPEFRHQPRSPSYGRTASAPSNSATSTSATDCNPCRFPSTRRVAQQDQE